MITMHLKGGLGNQLFQYALGRRLSLTNSTPLMLDITSFEADQLREYGLHAFNICAQIAPPDSKSTLTRRLVNKIQLNMPVKFFGRTDTLITENAFAFQPDVLNCKASTCLNGYWQSHLYFDAIESTLRTDLTLKHPLSNHHMIVKSEINASNSVSIHVRRGDYANNPIVHLHHGLCPLDWYQKAFKKMQTLVKDAQYYVFSDDPDWVKANMKLNAPTFFMPKSPDGKEAEDLYLMSQCKHNIIANSSFSWWAAWLNSNPEKNVVAPARWFAGADHDTKDLIPRDWIQI